MSATLAARLPEFNGQDIVFAAFACSQLRHVDDALPRAIAAELESRGVMSFKVSCPATRCPKLGRCSIIVSTVASSRVSELFLSELLSLPARVVRHELILTTHPGLVSRKAVVTNLKYRLQVSELADAVKSLALYNARPWNTMS